MSSRGHNLKIKFESPTSPKDECYKLWYRASAVAINGAAGVHGHGSCIAKVLSPHAQPGRRQPASTSQKCAHEFKLCLPLQIALSAFVPASGLQAKEYWGFPYLSTTNPFSILLVPGQQKKSLAAHRAHRKVTYTTSSRTTNVCFSSFRSKHACRSLQAK